MTKADKRAGALMAGGVVLALIALWWWALFGMREEVGVASFLTTFVMVNEGWLCMKNNHEI